MQTKFQFRNGMQGDLVREGKDLFFVLTDVPGQPGIARYHAARWVYAALRSEGFNISPNYDDQPVVAVEADETEMAANWIECIVRLQHLGDFVLEFRAYDPRSPF